MEQAETVTIEHLKSRANNLYSYCVLAGFGTAALLGVAAFRHLSNQTSSVSLGLAFAASLVSLAFVLSYVFAMRPVGRHKAREAALKDAFKEARRSSSQRISDHYESSPIVIADRRIAESLSKVSDIRASVEAQWQRMSWWQSITVGPPDTTELDKKVVELERAKRRLDATGDVRKIRAFYDTLEDRSQNRLDVSEAAALKGVPHSDVEHYDEKLIAKSALLFSAMSVPVSAWGDLSQAGNIYDVLREVNGNYAGMSDFDIWLNTLIMPGESLVGLVSLTKGAYFEQLVATDSGGELFEHFNHPDTDIVIDGVAFQIKATDSVSYVESVADGIPVIATSEVAQITGALDGGYSNEELETSVDLALGESVIDVQDTAVDAVLTGVGGLGILATLRGINHAFAKHQEGGDGFEAAIEGVGVAVVGTAKGFVDTAELGFKAINSRPSRFVGRSLLKGADAVGRKVFGSSW